MRRMIGYWLKNKYNFNNLPKNFVKKKYKVRVKNTINSLES